MSFSSGKLPLAAAFCLSILVQAAGLVLFFDEAVGFDSNEYLALSHSLYSSGQYSAPEGLNGFEAFQGEAPTRMRQPLYPILLVLFYWLPGAGVLPVLILQTLLLSASLVLLYKTASLILGDRFRPWSILFPALYFPWLLLSSKLLSEALFTFLIWAAAYSVARFIRSRRKLHLVFAGVLFGLLILTKSIGLAVLLLSSLSLVLVNGFKKWGGVPDWLVMSACAFAVVLPWGVRNYLQMGVPSFLPSNSGYNLWVASRAPDAPWWNDSREFAEATQDWEHYYIDQTADRNFRETAMANFSTDGFGVIARRAAYRLFTGLSRFPGTGGIAGMNIRFIALSLVQSGMLVLALVSLLTLRSREAWFLLALPMAALATALPVSKGLTRYLLPALPAMALLAGQWVLDLFHRIRGRR